MQTPYIIFNKRNGSLDSSISLEHRRRVVRDTENHRFVFYPPDDDAEVARFERRVHVCKGSLFYEDGFMIEYPEPYIEHASDKLPMFSRKSVELDGFYSRVVSSEDGTVTIDGSGMYLQTLCSYSESGQLVFSNLPNLLQKFVEINDLPLTRNDDFFINHFFNYSLAYYASCGSPYKEIAFHDSLESIVIGDSIESHLEDKFSNPAIADLSRADRLDLLYRRLRHTLAEYCQYTGAEVIGHNLTGGQDSRTSFAIFLNEVRDQMEVVTGGMAYTQDRVISGHIVRRYGLKSRTTGDTKPASIHFDYRAVMDKTDLLQWYIPMFRRIAVGTKFKSREFEASGYLGNVVTFSGTERNQIITDNRFHMDSATEVRMRAQYDAHIERLRAVYGDRCHAAFNIMFNTTNKVASVCRRLKKHTFCIFEMDLLQACYFLESASDKAAGGLHYELMRLADPALLYDIPFESNKSFPDLQGTFELPGFRESGMPRPYKSFAEENLTAIVAHFRLHREQLSFLDDRFFSFVESFIGEELPPLLTNKIFAALGTLEFQGIIFDGKSLVIEQDSDHYTPEFFEQVYLERERFASGLATMTYSAEVRFVTRVPIAQSEVLRVEIRSVRDFQKVESTTKSVSDGSETVCVLPSGGKYRVNWSIYDREKKQVTQLYRTTFVAKLDAIEEVLDEVPEKVRNEERINSSKVA